MKHSMMKRTLSLLLVLAMLLGFAIPVQGQTEPVECIKCGRCVDVCPMELSPLYFAKYADEENWQGMKDMKVMDCVECRCCEFICSSKIPIVTKIKAGKNAVRGMK